MLIKVILVILIFEPNYAMQEKHYPVATMNECIEILKASSTKASPDVKNIGGGDFEDLETTTVTMTCKTADEPKS